MSTASRANNHRDHAFLPVLVGNDINSYSMARAFHEAYGIKSIVFGKYRSGPSNRSQILHLIVNKDLEQDDVFVSMMRDVAQKNPQKKIIALGCGDNYVSLIIRNTQKLNELMPGRFILPYIGEDLMNELINKEKFYRMCDAHGIDYPRTLICRRGDESALTSPFAYPVILKPASSVEYWKYPFEGQDKVFKIKDEATLRATAKKIFDSGYNESIIVQDMIPGDDSFMRVLTCYSDTRGQVKLMSLGHVLLEEHTPKGLGNHAAILSDFDETLMQKIRQFLEKIKFTGFSNFDIKYDTRDGKFKVFEINLRQGRSNFYVSGSNPNGAHNLTTRIVDDYIEHKELSLDMVREDNLWLVIPQAVVLKYTKSPELRARVENLIRRGKVVNPLFYKADKNPLRLLYLLKSHMSHFKKYKTYYN